MGVQSTDKLARLGGSLAGRWKQANLSGFGGKQEFKAEQGSWYKEEQKSEAERERRQERE